MKFRDFLSYFHVTLRAAAIIGFTLIIAVISFGQHQGHDQMKPGPKPAASPTPPPSPSPTPSPAQTHANMPMPAASPSASPMAPMGGGGEPRDMSMGPLMVMSESRMAVRLGASESNVIDIGRMGSGTSVQPASSPMYMWDKIAGDWVFMLHFNFVAMVDAQGGPRGVTKFQSANWFMPMAFRRVG